MRVEYIPDQKRDIVETVLHLRERVGPTGVVFTSGGIGPTHDDITYESLAAAFGATLALHQPTVDRMVGGRGMLVMGRHAGGWVTRALEVGCQWLAGWSMVDGC